MQMLRHNDALEQRVEKTGGSNPAEFIYFNGNPIAVLNPSTGAWTDLIGAGKSMISEVAGSETATPVYRLLDNEGSLVATVGASGNVTGTTTWAPYGQVIYTTASDPYGYAGLYGDTEYGGQHAWYRGLSTEQLRWLSPDPYNGSYNLMDPQSLNRYSYVDDSPLANTDPSGLADGMLTGIGGSACSAVDSIWGLGHSVGGLQPGGFNYCNPVASIATALLSPAIIPLADTFDQGMNSLLGSSFLSISVSYSNLVPYVSATISIACSIDGSKQAKNACGPAGITSLIPGDWGKGTGDGLAVADAVTCSAGGPANPGCIVFTIYNIANSLYAFINSLITPQFHGTLIPRAADLGGLGTAPHGIPSGNLTTKMLLQGSYSSQVVSPGFTPR